ncbi:hypothetical protein [Amycolatopsis sp. Hca4]|uniref:hypothetical protein n=1 Tax=unclassified Amycolatopsis TaxID=2618356 RepID=UPI00159047CD|nr:hypothetical protein [Amycolatopsis sp. Hca4]QKV76760.1 hypothetical protein HUT10_25490 [Amycolatopsis sp. Hca4]
MKLWAKLSISVAAALGAAALAAPSASAAANPYTAAEACANDFGGSWSYASDGHREVKYGSAKWGDVYLMYNSAHANCVATIKSIDIGTPTYTEAWLWIQGTPDWIGNVGAFKYYAAAKGAANNRCVQYQSYISRTATGAGAYAAGGRLTWGNCG